MDRLKQLRTELERGVARAWEGLSEGWQELLDQHRSSLTYFTRRDSMDDGAAGTQAFPHWSLLPAESWETAKSVIVRLEIPGMTKDLDVSIHGRTLTIYGNRPDDAGREERRYHLVERAHGRFERRIALPAGADTRRAEVQCSDGVVTVILPKLEEAPPR